MKINTVILVIVAFIICIWFVSVSGRSTPPIPQAPDQEQSDDSDVLTSSNLLHAINSMRIANNISRLSEVDSLDAEASDLSSAAATTTKSLVQPTNGITLKFTHLNGDHYSVQDFIWNGIGTTTIQNVLLNRNLTGIGAWVSYLIPGKDAKPIPFVTILFQ